MAARQAFHGVKNRMQKPFVSDGCSGNIFRKIFRRDPPWLGCCTEHDRAYWMGGSRAARALADRKLMACVALNGHPVVAFAMWLGVRIGGHPLLPFPWRWGFGWRWPRNYR